MPKYLRYCRECGKPTYHMLFVEVCESGTDHLLVKDIVCRTCGATETRRKRFLQGREVQLALNSLLLEEELELLHVSCEAKISDLVDRRKVDVQELKKRLQLIPRYAELDEEELQELVPGKDWLSISSILKDRKIWW